MSGIQLDIGANTRDFQRGVSDVDKALDKVADSLDDVARDGEQSTEKLERSFKELADAAKVSGNKIGTDLDDGFDKAKAGADEFKQEANSTAKEAAASFDGSAESIVDMFQEVAANAFAGFGPAGAVAGLAAAAGIGIAAASIQDAEAQAEQSKDNVSELVQAYLEAPGLAQPGIDALADKLRDLATETDDNADSLLKFKKLSDESGLSLKKLATLTGASIDDVRKVWREADEAAQGYSETIKREGYSEELGNAVNSARAYRDEVGRTIGEMEKAAEAEKAWYAAGGAQLETRAAAVETYQSALDDAVGGFEEFKNAEDGALDPAAYLASIQERINATSSFNSNIQSIATQFGLTDAEVQAILDQGVDFAPMLQSIIDSGLAPEFVAQIQSAVGGGQDVLNGADLNATVAVEADSKPAEDIFQKVQNEDRTAQPIKADADAKAADAALDAVAKEQRTAAINARADTDAAQRALDNFVSRNSGRTIRMTADVRDRNGKPIY